MSTALLLSLALLAAPPEDFDTFFGKFVEKRAGIELLEADIVEETIQYGSLSSRRGQLLFGQPRRIIFRYEGDEPAMMIDDTRVYELDLAVEQLQIYDVQNSPESSLFFLGFDNDPRALKEAYDIGLFSVQSDLGQYGIEIRPYKEDMNSASFVSISIYLRNDDYLPYRIELELDEDTSMVTEFSNHKVNGAIDPARTQLRIPAGTRIIENNEVTLRAVPEGGLMMPPAPLDIATTPAGSTKPAPGTAEQEAPEQSVQVEELAAP